jgi:hypothetical protein
MFASRVPAILVNGLGLFLCPNSGTAFSGVIDTIDIRNEYLGASA